MKLLIKVLCVFGVFSLSTAQELQLRIVGNDSIETDFITSIGYPKTFNNFENLQTELTLFKNQLYQLGYIESQILEISQAQPLIIAKLALGTKYESLQLYADKTLFEFLELDGIKNIESSPYYTIEIAETKKKFLDNLEYSFSALAVLLTSVKEPNVQMSG